MMKVKTDIPDLKKDVMSGAITNESMDALTAYKKKKKYFRQNEKVDERLNNLEEDIGQIKDMLTELLGKNR